MRLRDSRLHLRLCCITCLFQRGCIAETFLQFRAHIVALLPQLFEGSIERIQLRPHFSLLLLSICDLCIQRLRSLLASECSCFGCVFRLNCILNILIQSNLPLCDIRELRAEIFRPFCFSGNLSNQTDILRTEFSETSL